MKIGSLPPPYFHLDLAQFCQFFPFSFINNIILYPFTKPETELVVQGTLQRRKLPKKCPPPTLPKPVIKKETTEQLPGCQGLTNNLWNVHYRFIQMKSNHRNVFCLVLFGCDNLAFTTLIMRLLRPYEKPHHIHK